MRTPVLLTSRSGHGSRGRRASILATIFVSLLAAGCSGGPKAGPSGEGDATEPGTLSGVVVDEAVRPLGGINVTLSNGQATLTGTDGAFRFTGLDSGVYVLRAKAAGYADTTTTVTVLAGDSTPLVKLVLLADASTRAYAESYVHEGFVQCSMYWDPGGYRFAACGAGNVGSLIVCSTTEGQFCLGNVTEDRYITVLDFQTTPQFLQTETFWDSTQAFGSEFYNLIGSATPEELQQPTSQVFNDTHGPSPLLATMDAEDFANEDCSIGKGGFFLSQTFAAASDTLPACTPGQPCVALGAVANQQFRMILHAFYGYTPPPDWRFSDNPEVPQPPDA